MIIPKETTMQHSLFLRVEKNNISTLNKLCWTFAQSASNKQSCAVQLYVNNLSSYYVPSYNNIALVSKIITLLTEEFSDIRSLFSHCHYNFRKDIFIPEETYAMQ